MEPSITTYGTREYLRANKLGIWAIENRIKVLELQQQNARAIRRIYLEASRDLARQIASMADGAHKEVLQAMQRSLEIQAASVGKSLKERLMLDTRTAVDYGAEGVHKPFAFVLNKAGAITAGKVTAAGLSRTFAQVNELAVLAQWARTVGGLTLSERIWSVSLKFRDELKMLIDMSVAEGLGAKKTAQLIEVLANKGGHQLKRTVLADYPKAWQRFGQYCWSKNTNWEALRLARTELNFSYHEAAVIAGRMTPGYVGCKWNLSPAHPEYDICDEYAENDEDGLGPGGYKSGNEPLFSHPNCLCYLTPIFNDDDSWSNKVADWVNGGSNPELDKWYSEVYRGTK